MHCRYLCLVSRRVVDASLSPEERRQYQDAELGPLGQLVTDAAAAYYAAAAERLRQKQLDLAAALGSSPPEVNAAIAFKVSHAIRLQLLLHTAIISKAAGGSRTLLVKVIPCSISKQPMSHRAEVYAAKLCTVACSVPQSSQ
eukprot:GHUV01033239.1.p1 GENE.GHUV01033239.1~~GHUV01033239.1.p1  ORF type:complete len:142 (-),score=40.00 GHUV01033239.1:462-887(-)